MSSLESDLNYQVAKELGWTNLGLDDGLLIGTPPDYPIGTERTTYVPRWKTNQEMALSLPIPQNHRWDIIVQGESGKKVMHAKLTVQFEGPFRHYNKIFTSSWVFDVSVAMIQAWLAYRAAPERKL